MAEPHTDAVDENAAIVSRSSASLESAALPGTNFDEVPVSDERIGLTSELERMYIHRVGGSRGLILPDLRWI